MKVANIIPRCMDGFGLLEPACGRKLNYRETFTNRPQAGSNNLSLRRGYYKSRFVLRFSGMAPPPNAFPAPSRHLWDDKKKKVFDLLTLLVTVHPETSMIDVEVWFAPGLPGIKLFQCHRCQNR